MPELPEVETIVRELEKKIVGLRIKDAWIDRPKIVRQTGGVEVFKKAINNKKILSVKRRAKYIIINIEGKKTIFIHQKISGHLLYGKWKRTEGKWESLLPGPLKDDADNKYIRLILFFNNGFQLALSDLRRFAKIILADDNKIDALKEIRELGPEPLEIDFKIFHKLFESAGHRILRGPAKGGGRRKKGRIKPVLMDPQFIAGIGNIYGDEILWEAGFHPLSRAENLNAKDVKKIFDAIQKVLKKAILHKGDSIDNYRTTSGEKGEYQNIQKAYQQTGKKCAKKDGGIIKRLKIGARSAHFCSKHQILK
ncbi:MAG: DNA-formamidopyrimidine glycosylase [Candidatus Yanofskybacteria bacterium RIFCSPHIGHO2_02_FULL_41_12]|uniref:Formamidopyrimidine-DNA glycosylase n=1 Tax=Candidatus Yanofskybacteria bacterium GW2011_GWC2_41_9 TaxID=1619029 RepID=A0A0G0XMA0_9BACT|nr:MAG: Formamidopyrimidine-DNA glycosylase [Candidatus Yanofskybacteria bacterium GW2011_GWC2_41_9]OGN08689.1 MAG: DNA-formamidopyrimidine glycosylase [Candidatus Yanofskybacteria bacterium RIFCSPHIGHO2_02_FULL_41_12]